MILEPSSVLVPASVVRRHGRHLSRVVAASFRQNGTPVPADLGEVLFELSRCTTPE
jgi:hypothetical protein